MVLLELVANWTTSWCHLHWLKIGPPGGGTCVSYKPGIPGSDKKLKPSKGWYLEATLWGLNKKNGDRAEMESCQNARLWKREMIRLVFRIKVKATGAITFKAWMCWQILSSAFIEPARWECKAVTGKHYPHSGVGEDSLARRTGPLTKMAVIKKGAVWMGPMPKLSQRECETALTSQYWTFFGLCHFEFLSFSLLVF